MILFSIFLVSILAGEVKIPPNGRLHFEDSAKQNQLYKFEFYESSGKPVHVIIVDNRQRKIAEWNTQYAVMHTKAQNATTYDFIIRNPNKAEVSVFFRCPDVKKELHGALGPIEDVDYVAAFEELLKNDVVSYRNYSKKQKQHSEMVSKSRIWIIVLMIGEIAFSIAIIRYLHVMTTSYFNQRIKM
ncbi:hypothetical protein CWI38_0687p0010 [Hamiltosporidium tvaerminnensis]|uniref:GOLD domain-containing protein n=2 Tax=Hamiltosporidium TaxID=1176354 RepID=A0A4Q9LVB2_9MICR|nr:hypothetical protein CWI36_0218p0020 [Hamiltosporidium magnivora]TBU11950.1 hypothetical protein CWI38_0966p0020 [Hamiltosporidium tvaerminnensis]TBU12633.1 hypothetical protein CWI38_0687p0010 [Hamiltosporidium tvaerminnensis]